MAGLYQKSMIIERSNRKIGVIGVILETTDVRWIPKNLYFLFKNM